MSFQKFSSFSRRGKGDFKAFGRGRRTEFYVPDLPGPEAFDITDDIEDRIFNEVKDRGIAKRVRQLQFRYPAGSLPELVLMDWLQRHRIPFRYQVPLFGARSLMGGQILDFTTRITNGLLVMRVMGYYHERPPQVRTDAAQRLALRSARVEGQ